jgi:predicted transcriptional regulator
LLLLSKQKELTLDEISESLNCNIKTISGHTHRLVQAGLLNKKYAGRAVKHSLSPYGKMFVVFAKKF